MKLKRFRVQMFRCVLDSGWVDVTDLTVLVGKNEAGKTSMLRALHKFNPFDPEPYSMPRAWPRNHRGMRSDSQVVCSAQFDLSAQETAQLRQMTDGKVDVPKLIITRDYAGRFEVQFPAGVFPASIHPNDVDVLCQGLPEPQADVRPEFAVAAAACRAAAIRLACEGRFSDLEALPSRQESQLAVLDSDFPQRDNEINYRSQYLGQLRQIAAHVQQNPSAHKRAHEFVIASLPTFVYMDDFLTFKGTAFLDQVKQRRDQGKLNADDQTLLTIMALAGMQLDEEVKKASFHRDMEERQHDLDDAAASLNRKIENHWKQLRYEVVFRADGQEFMTFVRGLNDKNLIRLEERSKGFQWFFSFDLMLMHETKGTLKDCVILMDEPGLHLHPAAQSDLLNILVHYARDNTLIYSTHLPFMIDLNAPDRIRVVSETDEGTVVKGSLTETHPEARMVMQTALGIGGQKSHLVAEQNIVVEGIDDYWILTALSDLFLRSGKASLPPEALLTAAGGVSEVTSIATFMACHNLDVVAVYDTDGVGNAARGRFMWSWLPRCKDTNARALSLGPSAGVRDREFSIEDFFPADFYIACMEAVYTRQLLDFLTGGGAALKSIPSTLQLVKWAEELFKGASLEYEKILVAKVICEKIRAMKDTSELPAGTLTAAESLFGAISDALASFRPKKALPRELVPEL